MVISIDSYPRPRLLFTLGDVAGIGPEIVARAWPQLQSLCRPVVVGDPAWVQRGVDLVGSGAKVRLVGHPSEAEPNSHVIPCVNPTTQNLSGVQPRRGTAQA